MIFGGEPEDGDGRSTGGRQLTGGLNRGERLIERVDGTREEANLLAGEHGHGAGLGKQVE